MNNDLLTLVSYYSPNDYSHQLLFKKTIIGVWFHLLFSRIHYKNLTNTNVKMKGKMNKKQKNKKQTRWSKNELWKLLSNRVCFLCERVG